MSTATKPPRLLSLAVAAFVAMACVSGGADATENGSAGLEKAMRLFRDAAKGFVPKGKKAGRTIKLGTGQQKEPLKLPSLHAYRLETLRKAVVPLKRAVQEGSAAQRATAHRMLAMVRQIEGKRRAAEAFTAWTELETRSVGLLGRAIGVSAIAARIDQMRVRESGETGKALKREREKVRKQLDNRKKRLERIKARIEKIRKKLERWRSKQSAAAKEASALASASFAESDRTVDGLREQVRSLLEEHGWPDAHRELLEAVGPGKKAHGKYLMDLCAILLRRKANHAATEAQLIETRLEKIRGKMTVLKSRVSVARRTIKALKKGIAEAKKMRKRLAQGRRQAEQRMAETIDTLRESFRKVLGDFHERVYKPVAFKVAGIGDHKDAAYRRALAHIRSAQSAADGRRPDLRVAELTARTHRVAALTNLAQAIDSFHGTVALVADRMKKVLGEKKASLFIDNRDSLAQRRRGVLAEAETALSAARKLAEKLGEAEEGIAKIAAGHADRLKGYRDRLGAIKAEGK